ncbi:hypothetical protein [Halosegnis marinus]|uniref:Uncharacterized protein n=1 Tax=Halosegnis marinus TaxID=3034023 RepID=A0ABD5ZKR2_9EURY|nr:hypothetical protein [Halosegnis sp. DT85]
MSLLDGGATRAGLFFLAGFLVATAGGVALGDPALGVSTGVAAGLALAAFGYLFVRPA